MRALISVLLFLLSPMLLNAEAAATGTHTYMSNGVFLMLAAIIFLLLLVIVGLAEMVKAGATHHRTRSKKPSALKGDDDKDDKNSDDSGGGDNDTKIRASTILFLLIGSLPLLAQDAPATAAAPAEVIQAPPFDYWGLGAQMFFVMVSVIVLELIFIYVLYRMGLMLIRNETPAAPVAADTFMESRLMKSITGNQTPEEEAAIMMDHEYDGIRELDNNLPLWWKYGFYLTIVVAVIYLFNYHVLDTGLSSKEEYEAEVQKAEAEIAEYKKNNANNVDENTVTQLIDATSIAAGKSIFMQNCAACHGASGEGTVGPNLTDDYWIHKGGITNVFRSIKYGWTDKGMKAWEQDLKPLEMQQVASFILTLRGTNPANAKAKEGELYDDGAAPVAGAVNPDSLSADSVNATDTIKK